MTAARKLEDCLRGQMVKRRRFAGFALTKTVFAAGCVSPEHVHGAARIIHVLRGGWTETACDSATQAHPGTMLWRPAGTWHASVAHERGATLLSVDFDAAWLTRAHASSALLAGPAEFQNGMQAHFGAMLAHEFQHADEVSGVAIEGILLGVLAEAARRVAHRAERRAPEWLLAARKLIEARFAERLTLEEIAASAGVHPVHLARAYRQHFDCTVGEHLRRLRMEFACREMMNSHNTLAAIALAAGFADQSHFSRSFKVHTGLTPAEYRLAVAR
jgi:AraC family transcriptional regulator